MNNKAFSMSLIMAVFAMFLVWSYVDSKELEFKGKYGAEEAVLVAAKDISELTPFTEEMVEIKKVPKNYVAPGVKKDKQDIVNWISAGPILKGEQITESRVTYPSTRTGLARQISSGKRSIGIPVNDVTGAGRLIKPGDRIDILASVKVGTQQHEREVRTILQNVYVLAVGANITNNLPVTKVRSGLGNKERLLKLNEFVNYNTVQVEVDPGKAQKLVFYLSMQEPLYALLRNHDDTKVKNIRPTVYRDIATQKSVPSAKRRKKGRNR